MKDVKRYLQSWLEFSAMCENKIKGRCILNNKGWCKLREFHMERWLQKHPTPFGFMFKLKHHHPFVYRSIPCANRLYYKSLRLRNEKFLSPVADKLITFPNWKGFFKG